MPNPDDLNPPSGQEFTEGLNTKSDPSVAAVPIHGTTQAQPEPEPEVVPPQEDVEDANLTPWTDNDWDDSFFDTPQMKERQHAQEMRAKAQEQRAANHQAALEHGAQKLHQENINNSDHPLKAAIKTAEQVHDLQVDENGVAQFDPNAYKQQFIDEHAGDYTVVRSYTSPFDIPLYDQTYGDDDYIKNMRTGQRLSLKGLKESATLATISNEMMLPAMQKFFQDHNLPVEVSVTQNPSDILHFKNHENNTTVSISPDSIKVAMESTAGTTIREAASWAALGGSLFLGAGALASAAVFVGIDSAGAAIGKGVDQWQRNSNLTTMQRIWDTAEVMGPTLVHQAEFNAVTAAVLEAGMRYIAAPVGKNVIVPFYKWLRKVPKKTARAWDRAMSGKDIAQTLQKDANTVAGAGTLSPDEIKDLSEAFSDHAMTKWRQQRSNIKLFNTDPEAFAQAEQRETQRLQASFSQEIPAGNVDGVLKDFVVKKETLQAMKKIAKSPKENNLKFPVTSAQFAETQTLLSTLKEAEDGAFKGLNKQTANLTDLKTFAKGMINIQRGLKNELNNHMNAFKTTIQQSSDEISPEFNTVLNKFLQKDLWKGAQQSQDAIAFVQKPLPEWQFETVKSWVQKVLTNKNPLKAQQYISDVLFTHLSKLVAKGMKVKDAFKLWDEIEQIDNAVTTQLHGKIWLKVQPHLAQTMINTKQLLRNALSQEPSGGTATVAQHYFAAYRQYPSITNRANEQGYKLLQKLTSYSWEKHNLDDLAKTMYEEAVNKTQGALVPNLSAYIDKFAKNPAQKRQLLETYEKLLFQGARPKPETTITQDTSAKALKYQQDWLTNLSHVNLYSPTAHNAVQTLNDINTSFRILSRFIKNEKDFGMLTKVFLTRHFGSIFGNNIGEFVGSAGQELVSFVLGWKLLTPINTYVNRTKVAPEMITFLGKSNKRNVSNLKNMLTPNKKMDALVMQDLRKNVSPETCARAARSLEAINTSAIKDKMLIHEALNEHAITQYRTLPFDIKEVKKPTVIQYNQIQDLVNKQGLLYYSDPENPAFVNSLVKWLSDHQKPNVRQEIQVPLPPSLHPSFNTPPTQNNIPWRRAITPTGNHLKNQNSQHEQQDVRSKSVGDWIEGQPNLS